MKEFYYKPEDNHNPIPEPEPTPNKRRRETPRWIVAKYRTDQKYQQMENFSTECAYHRVIERVKQLIPLHGGDNVFERDYKEEAESYTVMHSFITSSFTWQLECLLAYNYKVRFFFHNCPYEAEVRHMMEPYPLERVKWERSFPDGYDAYFKRICQVQPSNYFTAIKAQD
jgi:hypothetical protein